MYDLDEIWKQVRELIEFSPRPPWIGVPERPPRRESSPWRVEQPQAAMRSRRTLEVGRGISRYPLGVVRLEEAHLVTTVPGGGPAIAFPLELLGMRQWFERRPLDIEGTPRALFYDGECLELWPTPDHRARYRLEVTYEPVLQPVIISPLYLLRKRLLEESRQAFSDRLKALRAAA
jgi:hypothetical protein